MFATLPDRRQKLYRKGRIAFALLASVFGGTVTGLCSLFFAASAYNEGLFFTYFANPYILLLNLLPPIILSLLFYLLCNRAACAYLFTNLCTMGLTLVHYFKVAFRGDPLIAEDLTLITESGKMLETYKLYINKRLIAYLVILVLGTLLLALLARGRFRKKRTRLALGVALLLAASALVPAYTSERIYNRQTKNNDLIYEWSESQVFFSKGFVYPFLHSVRYAFHPAPDGYSASEAKAVLAAYTDTEIPKDKRVNIVCVMLEAYSDFSDFDGLTFTEDIYEKYHALCDMGYSGKLVTDIFAGDTRISERQFLTGMPYARLDNFVAPSNSYVWYLRKNGYVTTGSHPCYAWFYNRQNINKNLGFESYLFSENYYKELTGGDITYDARLFPAMRDLYLARDKETPYFSFSITYQGHGPYESATAYFDAPYVQRNAGVTDADETILNNYLQSIKGTTEQLYTFAGEMLATKEPLVLVFFGDHKPWMGVGNSTYNAYGIPLDLSTEAGFLNYYSTEYLILANDAAKVLTGSDFRGEGETLSVSFLMNKVFELCGYKGNAYMQCTSDILKKEPVIHRTDSLTDGDKALYDRISYYYRKNFLYESYEKEK